MSGREKDMLNLPVRKERVQGSIVMFSYDEMNEVYFNRKNYDAGEYNIVIPRHGGIEEIPHIRVL